MRILSASVSNFGSYKYLEFDFTDKGITQIAGPTGSGKSTFMDMVPWILYGRTSKDGAADEIIGWHGDGSTVGSAVVEINGKTYEILRVRGKVKELYYQEVPLTVGPVRGKDLPDTQRLINQILGITPDQYLLSAYLHEFSPISSFFATTAKNRRLLTEQIVDLTLAKDLAASLSDHKKALKKEMDETSKAEVLKRQEVSFLENALVKTQAAKDQWQKRQTTKIAETRDKLKNFDREKEINIQKIVSSTEAKLVSLQYDLNEVNSSLKKDKEFDDIITDLNGQLGLCGEGTCTECGAPKNVQKRMSITKKIYQVEREKAQNNQLKVTIARLTQQIESTEKSQETAIGNETSRSNPYQAQLEALKAEENPHQVKSIIADRSKAKVELTDIEQKKEQIAINLSDAELLSDVTDTFRASLIKNTITGLEYSTNKLLTDYFDGEINVKFDVESDDKLDVTITKDGNIASYAQLSKGQRQLLKLCFGVSVMTSVANHHGTHFSQVFLDEALDGLDDNMKVKAFGVLQELGRSHESVFCIDHSAVFSGQFTQRYNTIILDGYTTIKES